MGWVFCAGLGWRCRCRAAGALRRVDFAVVGRGAGLAFGEASDFRARAAGLTAGILGGVGRDSLGGVGRDPSTGGVFLFPRVGERADG